MLHLAGVLEAAVYDGAQQLGLEHEVAEVGRVDGGVVTPIDKEEEEEEDGRRKRDKKSGGGQDKHVKRRRRIASSWSPFFEWRVGMVEKKNP